MVISANGHDFITMEEQCEVDEARAPQLKSLVMHLNVVFLLNVIKI